VTTSRISAKPNSNTVSRPGRGGMFRGIGVRFSRALRAVILITLVAGMALPLSAAIPTVRAMPGRDLGPSTSPAGEDQCFYPVADTYASSASPNSNYGGEDTLVIQDTDAHATRKFAYLSFDLSPIPSESTILSAELKMYLTQSSAFATYSLSRISGPWQEFNLTWNNRPPGGGNFDAPNHSGSTGWKSWNAVQPVSDWINGAYGNYGLAVSTGFLDAPSRFASREGPSWSDPRLCVEWTTSGQAADLMVTGLEVTQAIQDLNNSVRLVAGKRTFVRLHVRSAQGDYRTFATLAVTCDGFGRILHPVNPGTTGYLVVRPSPSRAVQNHSFLFELPSDCADEAEQIRMSGMVNPTTTWRGYYPQETNVLNNWSGEYFLTFETAPQLATIVYLADYEYTSGATTTSVSTPASDAFALRSWLRRAYPVGDVWMAIRRIDFGATSVDDSGSFTYPTAGDFNTKLAAKRTWDLAHENWYEDVILGNERHIRYYGMTDDEGGFMRGSSPVPGTASSGPTGHPSNYSFTSWDTDDVYGDWYGGHEIGHSLGRPHVDCRGDEAGPDSSYPHTGGLISTDTTGSELRQRRPARRHLRSDLE